MPTYLRSNRFIRDWDRLDEAQRERFRAAVKEFVEDLRRGRGFRPRLRVKGVRGAPGVFEMTWADDGRATWQYGSEQHPGEVHVIWRRVGSHDIFREP